MLRKLLEGILKWFDFPNKIIKKKKVYSQIKLKVYNNSHSNNYYVYFGVGTVGVSEFPLPQGCSITSPWWRRNQSDGHVIPVRTQLASALFTFRRTEAAT